jgi:hypothetical protein
MSTQAAELSSLATILGDVIHRLEVIGEAYRAAQRDDLAGEIREADRGLVTAVRRLERIMRAEGA